MEKVEPIGAELERGNREMAEVLAELETTHTSKIQH